VQQSVTTDDVVRAATGHYLAGHSIEMSRLAEELGISRATLYRRVGQHENLIGLVLAGQTAATFHRVAGGAAVGSAPVGPDRVRTVVGAFMAAAIAARPLQQLVAREPVLFARIVMAPGHVERTATALLADFIDAEVDAGGFVLRIAAERLAQAVVRVGDSFMYAHLLNSGPPQVADAMAIIDLLVGSAMTRNATRHAIRSGATAKRRAP
jgi:AcrR family transcriptional regulator